MNTRDQSKPLANALHEDYQGRGLRILAGIIARNLIKRREVSEEKAHRLKADDLQESKDNVESLS